MLVIGATLSLAQEFDHDSHEHGEHFKQAAVYNMTAGNNSLIVVPGGDATSFAEDVFAFMVMPAATADEDGLERAEDTAVAGTYYYYQIVFDIFTVSFTRSLKKCRAVASNTVQLGVVPLGDYI